MERWLEHHVTEAHAGRSIRDLVREELGVSGRMIQRLTRSRGIRLNGRPAHLATRARIGDVVAVRVTQKEDSGLPPVPMDLTVAHEDDELLVIDKPAGMLVHPVAPHHTRTLAHGIAQRFLERGIQAKVRPVHRLDRDTSGLVLFAKSSYAHQHLDRQLRSRTLERAYLALVSGTPDAEHGTIDAPLVRRPDRPELREVGDGGERAVTHYRVRERLRGASLLEMELETGRTHQIRAHLAHVGHPLIGDLQYGGPAAPGLGRQALHAWRLAFDQPSSGKRIRLVSSLPDDLEAARQAFGGRPEDRPVA